MGGNEPDGGDVVIGNFNSFGTKDFFNKSDGQDSRLYIDDYSLTEQGAYDKLRGKCP